MAAASSALEALGVQKGDRIGIISENRPEWTVADLAILSLGAIVVPVYPSSSPADLSYFVENADVKVFFVSSLEQLHRTSTALLDNPRIKRIILFDDAGYQHPKVTLFHDFLKSAVRSQDLEKKAALVSNEEYATIIYTSGTTGNPKGVVLTHSNFVQNYLGARERIRLSDKDVALSFLPLNHVFERMAGYYFMAFHGASIWYAESMQTVAEDMGIVKPTVAAAVPRFYEKVYSGMLEKVAKVSPLQKKIFSWAVSVARKRYTLKMSGKCSLGYRLQRAIADKIVFSKVREKLGGRLRFFISGGAPLPRELAEFFYGAGILILEGYGLTETAPVIAVNTEDEFRFGSVGKPLGNAKVKIAEDGEILTQGPCVMPGYYKNPEATAECIKNGWFHTGDVGELDAEGYLRITDRKKDIIATSGGKKVSPQNIEGLLQGDPLFSQVVVVGDKRNYLTALIVPNRSELSAKAAELGLSEPLDKLLKNPEICSWAQERLKSRIAHLAPYEQIKYFRFLPEELTVAGGELTPTMKVKRKVVMEKFRQVIEEMYEEGRVRRETGSAAQA